MIQTSRRADLASRFDHPLTIVGTEVGPIMDISEDCWEHVGLLQEVSAAEPPPPPPAPDFLIQQQEVSSPFLFLFFLSFFLPLRVRASFDRCEKSAGDWIYICIALYAVFRKVSSVLYSFNFNAIAICVIFFFLLLFVGKVYVLRLLR